MNDTLLPSAGWRTKTHWLKIGFIILLIFLVAGVYLFLPSSALGEKIWSSFPYHTLVAGVPGNQQTIKTAIGESLKSGITFKTQNAFMTVPLEQIFPTQDPEDEKNLLRFSLQETFSAIDRINKERTWGGLYARWKSRTKPLSMSLPIVLDREVLAKKIEKDFTASVERPKDAGLKVVWNTKTVSSTVILEPEHAGTSLDINQALKELEKQATSLSFTPITLRTILIQPNISTADLELLKTEVTEKLKKAPFKLTLLDQEWSVTTSTLAGWLNYSTSTERLFLVIDPLLFKNTVSAWAKDFLHEKKDGLLVLTASNTVQTFETPLEGVGIDAETTIANILESYSSTTKKIPLILKTTPAIIKGDDAKRLGIQEVIGVGRSNFAGSPINRRKNIVLGAKKVNGSMVPPGEEFSLMKTLGHIDADGGWFQELVIKGNKTIPEYGGGLCQIGTTAFRAALGSALPITARTNHAYRVPYYEPAGKDATVYEPAPDFRFKNDTPAWILITTHIQGNEAVFTFWGTKDGRTVVQTPSIIYNIVPPPPEKTIETLELKPGEKKCSEKAHSGADAKFDYIVTYPNSEAKKVTFFSHYKPWGAVCLLGVKELTTTSTTPVVDESGINNPN